ncbi:hypothetical protein [Acutalibacter caecimuris]|uniref:hypothetical protein n=1 Tax=Acutalibacter caecimuris TaxID=3093657 RepID=UPI002AC93FCB|nr:hypothetical protein [Acutalibacter sp. M00118]
MIVQTYQSKLVLKTLKAGETYRAKPNLKLRGEYDAMIDMLGLHCECPVFAVVKGKRQNTGGKVSGSVRLTLEVPDEYIHLTEYSEWADFIYAFKFSKPGNYKVLRPDCEEITVRRYNQLMENLKQQKKPSQYDCPQVVLEKIEPSWLKSVKIFGKSGLFGRLLRR